MAIGVAFALVLLNLVCAWWLREFSAAASMTFGAMALLSAGFLIWATTTDYTRRPR